MNALYSLDFQLEPHDNDRLQHLCGEQDDHLKQIERRLGVEIASRGSSFRILGTQHMAELAKKIIDGLYLQTEDDGQLVAADVLQSTGSALRVFSLVSLGAVLVLFDASSELILIRITSALTLCVIGVGKLLLTIVFSVIVFSETLTPVNVVGFAFALLGVFAYNYHKQKEDKTKEHVRLEEDLSGLEIGNLVVE